MIRTEEDGILCPACMMPQKSGWNSDLCEYCGNPLEDSNKAYQLNPGTKLADRYIVGKVLGEGGFGITYIGWDTKLSGRIAIKEYFPVGYVDRRAGDGSDITVTAGNEAHVFEKQKKRFIEEAKILGKFLTERTIVSVSDIIRENNTAYTVMNLIIGKNLSKYLKETGKLSFNEAYSMLRPVMVSLGKVHAAGLVHRDLSPSNLMVQEDGSLILLDFGSAREYDEDNDKSMSVILKPGYAPSEQYISHGAQGPWTDVYSMCATLYKMITGVTPVNALIRMGTDTLKLPIELGADISPEQEEVLMKGLNITKEGRYSSMSELINAWDNAETEDEKTQKLFGTVEKTEEQTDYTSDTLEYEDEESTQEDFEGVKTEEVTDSAFQHKESVDVEKKDEPKHDKKKRKAGGKATIIIILAVLVVGIIELVAVVKKSRSAHSEVDNKADIIEAVDTDENEDISDNLEEKTTYSTAQEEKTEAEAQVYVMIENYLVNVRADADGSSEKVWLAKEGEIYKLLAEERGTDGRVWYQIENNEGKKGYIRYEFGKEIEYSEYQ